ncbi:MAG: DUF1963 domain-containing protein [Bacteroidota bacterium]
MIPDFLKPYEKALEKYKREAIHIDAHPVDIDILKDPLPLTQSKFLGLPFFPKSKPYPKDKAGHPMRLAAQINFSEVPHLEGFPEDGILQLFLSGSDWYDEESMVIYHNLSELSEAPFEDFSFLKEEDYDEMPIHKVHKLSFSIKIENGGLDDVQFDFQFDDLNWLDFVEQLSEEDLYFFYQYFDTDGHKMGEYAAFTQTDPREYAWRKPEDIHVLQIDSKDEIMFGDVGLGHVFINPEDLQKRDFAKAYFTWDCC